MTVHEGSKDVSSRNHTPSTWYENDKKIGLSGSGTIHQYEYLFGGSSCLDHRGTTQMKPGTTAHRSALYIATVGTAEMLPFHLPDTRADREFRIDYGSNWNLSSSFPCDITGEYTLKLSRVIDFRLIEHVDTRTSSKYHVQLPPINDKDQDALDTWDGELGVWFETLQWGNNRKIIVKGTKRGKFCYNNTEIQVGDELLAIDGNDISQMSFNETMKLLKERLSTVLDIYRSKNLQPLNTNMKVTPNQKRNIPKFLKRFDRALSSSYVGQTILDSDHFDSIII
jgi:hypothetical protein